jgi:hypothetical protein
MSMRKILNEWRRFTLQESENAPDFPYDERELEPNLSVFHETDGETHAIILYKKKKYVDDFYIIGYISVDLLTDSGDEKFNCIPNTYQIGAVYVEQEMRGNKKEKYGKKMYDLAYGAIEDDAGLTSDKYSGSLPKAKISWEKMEANPEIEKKKTKPKGNDKFDYDGKTTPDDKMDDCITGMNLGSTNATHHSLKKKNNSEDKAKLAEYVAQHEQNDFLNRADVESRLMNKAVKRFLEIYSKLTNYG